MATDQKKKASALTRITNWLLGREAEEEFKTNLPSSVDDELDVEETKREIDEEEQKKIDFAKAEFRKNVKNTKKRIEDEKESLVELQEEMIVLDDEAADIKQATEDIKELDNTLVELDAKIEADQKFKDAKKLADAEEKAKAESEAKHEEELAKDPDTQDNSIIDASEAFRVGKFADYEVDTIQEYIDDDVFENVNWEQLADTLNRTKQSVKNKAKAMIKKRKK